MGVQTAREATSVSRLLRMNALSRFPGGPGAANANAHVESRQSVDDYNECDLGLLEMSHSFA